MELTVAIFERRSGGAVVWATLGLGDFSRSRAGRSRVKLRQRMTSDLRKALRDAEPASLEALQLPVGVKLERPRLELSLRGSWGGRRRRSGRFPLIVAPRVASPGRRLQVAYHPLRQDAWFPVGDDASLEDQATLFFEQEWRDLADDEIHRLESGRRDRLRFLAFNARTRGLLDSLKPGDDDQAMAGAGRRRFVLGDVGNNESERAADGGLPLGRPRPAYRERLARLLAGDRARSVLLVGAPGVGKTILVHRLVADLLAADGHGAHGNLDRCRAVWRISGRRLIAGMSYMGQWEERAIGLIARATSARLRRDVSRARFSRAGASADRRRIVLWIEDLHAFGRIGRTVESDRALADVFQAPLARGEITVIGECTPGQLQVLEDDAPALAAALAHLHVDEPSRSETLSMMIAEVRELELVGPAGGGQAQHGVIFEPSALRALLEVADTLFSASALPGKALELLRALARHGVAEPGGDDDQPRRLGGRDVLALAAERTGIPPLLLEPARTLTAATVEADLERSVLGQPQAIAAARDAVLRLKTGLVDPERPYAVALFTGPTGTGKTELAKAVAAYLFRSAAGGSRLVRFDMSEYSDPDAAARLAGDRARPQGLLTTAVSEQPFCVVLLDEIEKCHPSVLNLLLQVMGDGRLTDAAGNVADFTHAVLIMTSNLGAGGASLGFGDRAGAEAQDVQRAVRDHFPPELFNRIDRVVTFSELSPGVARAIAGKEVAHLLERRGLVDRDVFVSVTGGVLDRVAGEGFDPEQGARSLKRYLDRHLGGLLAEQIAGSPAAAMRSVRVYASPAGFGLDVEALREAEAMSESRLEPLLAQPVEALRGRLPAALEFVEDLVEGPELARLSTELRRHLKDFRIGASGTTEKIYDLGAMRDRLADFRDRLKRQVEASDPDESELIEFEQFGVLTLKKERGWFGRLRARLIDARAFETPKQAGRLELLALLAETHFIRRALDGVRDGSRHAVLVELRRIGLRAPGSDPAAGGLLEWLAAVYAEDFGELESFAVELAAADISEGTDRRSLDDALEGCPRHLVLKIAGLSVLDAFAGEAGCHLNRGLASATEIVSVAVRPAAAGDEPRAVLEELGARRRSYVAALESGTGDLGENPDGLAPIVRRSRYDPPAPGGWTRCEVEDYRLCYAGNHRVRAFAEVVALLSLLHRSIDAGEGL